MLALMQSQTGCYTYVPAGQGGFTAGARVAYTLTDRGRVALADQVGPGALRVEGTLAENTGSSYVLRMSSVRTIDGATARWGGERVTIGHDLVANSFERKLSRTRTAVAAGVAIVGITAFVLTRNLNLFGIGQDDGGDRNPPPDQ
jgi:hypothetical protein